MYEYNKTTASNIKVNATEEDKTCERELMLGDVVQLKSGGPAMTIDNISCGKASCVWFFRGGEMLYRNINLTSLKRVKDVSNCNWG